MDYPFIVGIFYPFGYLGGDIKGVINAKRLPLLYHLFQALPINEVHSDKISITKGACVMDHDDVIVAEIRNQFRLVFEPGYEFFVPGEFRVEYL